MSKVERLLERMRANPRDCTESLETVARRYGIEVRKTGGGHFVFMHPDSELAVTVPFRRPIKPVYITQFLALLDDIGAGT
jgi:predicted RNA binding protein YcfA (HicA-like mRNA interferase family)